MVIIRVDDDISPKQILQHVGDAAFNELRLRLVDTKPAPIGEVAQARLAVAKAYAGGK